MRQYFAFLPIALLSLLTAAHAQQPVATTGTVVDAESGQPVVGASVRVEDAGRRTFTASNGTFRLPLAPGEHTIVASSIGYRPATATVRGGATGIVLRLTPSPVSLRDVTVSAEITPEEIVRRSIARKQENRERLKTFQGLLYSKFILGIEGNAFGKIKDEDRDLIAETFSRNYYEQGKGTRIQIIQRRQTANLDAADNLFALGNFVSFYDESIQVLNTRILSPLADDPFSRYRFRLVGRAMLDSDVVYVIGVEPATRLLPAFEGTIKIEREHYNLVEVDLAPSASTSIAFVRNLHFQQKLERFDGDVWQPTYLKITGDADIQILKGIAEVQPKIVATSIFTEVKVNEPLPDSVFKEKEIITALPEADSSRPEFWEKNSLSELSPEEKEIYTRVDSLVTVADTTGELSGFRFGLYPVADFNRVTSVLVGAGIHPTFPGPARIDLQGSYSFGLKRAFGTATANVSLLDDEVGLDLFGSVFSRVGTVGIRENFPRLFNAITALLFNRDYYDYYRSDGWSAGLRTSFNRLFATAELGGSRESSLPRTTPNSLFRKNVFRDNRPIVDGNFRTADATIGWGHPDAIVLTSDFSFGINARVSGLYGETEDGSLSFRGADGLFDVSIPTIPTGYAPMYLRLGVAGGIASETTPVQYQFRLRTSNAFVGRFGDFLSAPVDVIGGTRYATIYAEHSFSDFLWRLVGLPTYEGRGLELSIGGGAAQFFQDAPEGFLPTGKTWYTEAGFGIGKIPIFISNVIFLSFDARWGIGPLGAGKFGAMVGISSPF
jgi:hypothetical protein